MATELSNWYLHMTRISSNILCVGKFKIAARFAEPTEAEIVALLEKATPENTKKPNLKGYSSGQSHFSEINAKLAEENEFFHSFCSKMFRNARK